jgi:hypothetical protein
MFGSLADKNVIQRTRYLNAVNTFRELISMGVVPIVNENDTVSVSVRLPTLIPSYIFSNPGGTSRKSNLATMTPSPP